MQWKELKSVGQRLLNVYMRKGKNPEEWRTGLIDPKWKMKGDLTDLGRYQSITLLSCVMKLLERILIERIRKWVEQEMGEEQ